MNRFTLAAALLGSSSLTALAFDGRPWNVSTGNLSISFIRTSPIGAGPQPNYLEPPPSVEAMVKMKQQGLIAYEDYVAWGAVEREPGKWQWKQHEKIADAVKKAGLNYVVYNWTHFPPVWLRESGQCTLMKSLNTGKECNFFSIFDPRTIEHYDHFYKNLAAHLGDRIDGVYACILGPYGEGNYPLYVPDFVNVGPSHEGYWAGDKFALIAFRDAMKAKYAGDLAKLSSAWGIKHASWDDVVPPTEIGEPFKPNPVSMESAENRRRWLDFITWYDQALIDFAEKTVQVTLKYFPKEKVRTKPGGNSGGVNPLAYGTYCPGFAKMAGKYGIVMQPADCHGAYFGDKWIGTAYQFYKVPLATEPAGNLDPNGFVRRMFSDASCGAAELFTYEFERHAPSIRRYIRLYTGVPGETEIAALCPTTLYRLAGDVKRTISAGAQLRDLAEYDVLDELLIADGALTNEKYKALIVFQPDFVEDAVLDKIEAWVKAGGTVILGGNRPMKNVAGERRLTEGKIVKLSPMKNEKWIDEITTHLAGMKGFDGKRDGLMTCRRGDQVLVYNANDKPTLVKVDMSGTPKDILVQPHSIWRNH
ncbi:MAG: alpha-amylase family protein [Tepidisphaeraceae bacterium]